jgi:hypothetical protein
MCLAMLLEKTERLQQVHTLLARTKHCGNYDASSAVIQAQLLYVYGYQNRQKVTLTG